MSLQRDLTRAPRPYPDSSWPSQPQIKEFQHHCIIHDAWRGMRHVVQLRAREEFGHGSWSTWSQEAVGTPWTGTVRGAGGCVSSGDIPVTSCCAASHPEIGHPSGLWKAGPQALLCRLCLGGQCIPVASCGLPSLPFPLLMQEQVASSPCSWMEATKNL